MIFWSGLTDRRSFTCLNIPCRTATLRCLTYFAIAP
nr:MAG TPA_asm: hypothetical protein [Caudoviricetes sp.]